MATKPAMGMNVRYADEREVNLIAQIWYDGWQDAHALVVPAELRRVRTLDSFKDRLRAALSTVRVIGPTGEPFGFCMTMGDELYQLYVSANSRGSGVAQTLIDDAETLLSQSGVETTWLSCAIGNDRAARFYEKCGWRRVGNMINRLDTLEGEFLLETWRYEKHLTSEAASPKL